MIDFEQFQINVIIICTNFTCVSLIRKQQPEEPYFIWTGDMQCCHQFEEVDICFKDLLFRTLNSSDVVKQFSNLGRVGYYDVKNFSFLQMICLCVLTAQS